MKIKTTNEAAVNAYLANLVEIKAKLTAMLEMANDHFGTDPETINWGHVGDVTSLNSALKEMVKR